MIFDGFFRDWRINTYFALIEIKKKKWVNRGTDDRIDSGFLALIVIKLVHDTVWLLLEIWKQYCVIAIKNDPERSMIGLFTYKFENSE